MAGGYKDLEEQAGAAPREGPPDGRARADTLARALQAVSVAGGLLAAGWLLFAVAMAEWGGDGRQGGAAVEVVLHRGGRSAWAGLSRALAASGAGSALVIVGGAEGRLFSARKGEASGAATSRTIASASKWLVAGIVLRLVEEGHLSLEDHPQQYLPFWTSEPHDKRAGIKLRHLLSLTSGFAASGSACQAGLDAYDDVQRCARRIHSKYANMTHNPGEIFHYSADHLVVAAAMALAAYRGKAQCTWGDLFNTFLARPLGMQTSNATVSPSGAPALGQPGMLNVMVSPNDYALYLQSISPQGGLIAEGMRPELFADATRGARFDPDGRGTLEPWFSGERWHYSLGHWVECRSGGQGGWVSGACSADSAAAMHSSVGAGGFYPVLVNPRGARSSESYFAIVAFQWGVNGDDLFTVMAGSVKLFRELQPHIEEGVRRARQG